MPSACLSTNVALDSGAGANVDGAEFKSALDLDKADFRGAVGTPLGLLQITPP